MENRQLETDKGKVILSSNNFLFFHNLNTDEGSSGGPIVLVNNYRVMGIHRGSYEKYHKN
jgi:V8-like Glu-specific endopeptidase